MLSKEQFWQEKLALMDGYPSIPTNRKLTGYKSWHNSFRDMNTSKYIAEGILFVSGVVAVRDALQECKILCGFDSSWDIHHPIFDDDKTIKHLSITRFMSCQHKKYVLQYTYIHTKEIVIKDISYDDASNLLTLLIFLRISGINKMDITDASGCTLLPNMGNQMRYGMWKSYEYISFY
jgi:hypothetical protein